MNLKTLMIQYLCPSKLNLSSENPKFQFFQEINFPNKLDFFIKKFIEKVSIFFPE